MNATQDPRDNAIPPGQPPKKRLTAAETQRRYRIRIQREAQAYRDIRDIVLLTESDNER